MDTLLILSLLMLLMVEGCLSQSDTFEKPRNVKQYVEARKEFTRAMLFIQTRLPSSENITSNETLRHVNFGVLVSVLGGLVKAEGSRFKKPLQTGSFEIILDYASYAKQNCSILTNQTNTVLNNLENSVKPFYKYMDKLCEEEEYDCNILIDSALRTRHSGYGGPAGLLLRLQKISKYVNQNAKLIDKIINDADIEPYILFHIHDKPVTKFIRELTKVYEEFRW